MNLYIKQKISVVVGSLLLLFVISGCSLQNERVSTPKTVSNTDEIDIISEKINNVDKIPNINDVVILVDDLSITRKDFEIQKIYQEGKKDKEIIHSLIRTKATKAEAIRLNIEPSKDKIDAYLMQTREGLYNKDEGSEIIITYIEALGLSTEEYLELLGELAYDMYQREALWEHVKERGTYTDYEEYVNSLAEKADVKFIDVQIEKIYRG